MINKKYSDYLEKQFIKRQTKWLLFNLYKNTIVADENGNIIKNRSDLYEWWNKKINKEIK